MKNARGHSVLLIMLVLPILVLFLFIVADVMNVVKGKNWEIHRRFVAVKEELQDKYTKKTEQEAHNTIEAAKQEIAAIAEEMNRAVGTGYQVACQAALDAVGTWAPKAAMVPLYGRARIVLEDGKLVCVGGLPLFCFDTGCAPPDPAAQEKTDRVEPEAQWPTVGYAWKEDAPDSMNQWNDPPIIH